MRQWLSDFKLALIEENMDKLEALLNECDLNDWFKDLLKTSSHKENQNVSDIFFQIKALLEEAIKLTEEKKKTKAFQIQKFQKVLKYVKS